MGQPLRCLLCGRLDCGGAGTAERTSASARGGIFLLVAEI